MSYQILKTHILFNKALVRYVKGFILLIVNTTSIKILKLGMV